MANARVLTGLLSAFLMVSFPVVADEKLDAAIDAYFEDDFSKMKVIESHARKGDALAQSVMGQAKWFGIGVSKNRAAGLDWLKKAAGGGDKSAAVQLGRIYETGYDEAPRSEAEAIRWYIRGAELGDTITAPRELSERPRDVVIAAGGAKWAAPAAGPTPKVTYAPAEPSVPAPLKSGPPTPIATEKPTTPQLDYRTEALIDQIFGEDRATSNAPPAPAAPVAPAKPPTTSEPADPGALADALFELITGVANMPAPYVLRDGTTFMILADTPLSTTGDLAATCHVALSEQVKTDGDRLSVITKEMKAGNRSHANEASRLSASLQTQTLYLSMAMRTLSDQNGNGGFNSTQVDEYYKEHTVARTLSPSEPTAADCQSRMTKVIGDIALSEAEGRHWGE